ncbi:hypothetical protein GCK72_016319 [Caenorhabditis remanei]|nr:hypothetical protein GCK72_016319 [Caenorhabditis remanei]KAF1759852.1 hypothetical protein GCK72_016319 [Caenorhabditis remanei]
MLYKVVFAVVVSFALTSALPITGDIGGSLPSPLGGILKQLTDLLDSFKDQLPVPLPELPEVPLPEIPELPILPEVPTIPEVPTFPEIPTVSEIPPIPTVPEIPFA